MDINETKNVLKMQDTMLDMVANIKAIEHVLYDSKITTPQALQQVFEGFRKKLSDSPQGQRLEEAQNSLGLLKSSG